MWVGEQINEKYQNLKTMSQNNQKSNQHIVGINVNVHTKYEVSMNISGAEEQIKEKYQNGCHLKTTIQNH